jgi:hypothetical protein
LERCWDFIRSFDEFGIVHIFRTDNSRANRLAWGASGYRASKGRFDITKKMMLQEVGVLTLRTPDCPAHRTGLSGSTPDYPVRDAGLSGGEHGSLILALDDPTGVMAGPSDWRGHLITYL